MKKGSVIVIPLLICAVLSSCSRAVRSPADELCMSSWRSELDNGNAVSLIFNDETAAFCAENDAFTLKISGIYVIDDDTLIISDAETKMNYSFGYTVHGDCAELSWGGGTVTLDKS